jgi:hypothetical protein
MPIEQEWRQVKAACWCETEIVLGSEECGGYDLWPEANITTYLDLHQLGS